MEKTRCCGARVSAPWRSSGSLQEFRHSGGRGEGDFTAAFLAGEDNFLLRFKIYFYT